MILEIAADICQTGRFRSWLTTSGNATADMNRLLARGKCADSFEVPLHTHYLASHRRGLSFRPQGDRPPGQYIDFSDSGMLRVPSWRISTIRD